MSVSVRKVATRNSQDFTFSVSVLTDNGVTNKVTMTMTKTIDLPSYTILTAPVVLRTDYTELTYRIEDLVGTTFNDEQWDDVYVALQEVVPESFTIST